MGRLRRRVTIALVVAALPALPSPADAGRLAVETRADGTAAVVFRGEPGQADDVRLRAGPEGLWRVKLPGPLVPSEPAIQLMVGAGCLQVDLFNAECPSATGKALPGVVFADAGDDQVDLSEISGRLMTVDGGPGDDRISSGLRRDAIYDLAAAAPQLPPETSLVMGGPGDDSLNEFGYAWSQEFAFPPFSCKGPRQLFQAYLVGGPGEDRVCDTFGPDTLDIRDGERDLAACTNDFGPGNDVVIADRLDFVGGNCGTVRRRGHPGVMPLGLDSFNSESTAGDTWAFHLGCPADGPRRCVGQLRVRRPQPPDAKRSGGLYRQKRFNVSRGQVRIMHFLPPPRILHQGERFGVRAVVLTELPSGRQLRQERTFKPAPIPESGE
jgi:hypothetical protein